MTLERINPQELARPSGFAYAARTRGTVTVHIGGQTAVDADGRIVGSGVVEQFEQALGNLPTALRAAGGGPEHLAALTIHVVDVPDYRAHAREIGQVGKRLAGTGYQATAGIGVARLWDDDALVEVQGVAEIPDQA